MNNWINKAIEDLDVIIGKMSMRDYIATNYKNGKKRSKKHIPYCLGQDCIEAIRLKKLCYKVGRKEIDASEIELEVKSFLLPYRKNGLELV